jgi:DNA invertase Pin-like site-specific DNA recombinase
MKRVIELIRVSTEAQAGDDRASIPAQIEANRRTAARYELEIAESIQFSDVSGAAVLLAPEMQKLLKLIQSPSIQGVVTREFSRLMRPDKFTDYVLLQVFVDTHTILYLPDGPIDLSSKSGRLMGTIRAAIAGLEKTEIQERVWGAKEQKRRQGENPSSAICLPRGVSYVKGRGWSYTEEAEKVKAAFALLLQGETSYKRIAATVGIPRNSLRFMLRNPIWIGWRVYSSKRDQAVRKVRANGRQGDRPKMQRAPDEVIRVKVIQEPLLPEAEFQHAQRIMDAKAEAFHRGRDQEVHRFAYNGFLQCSCGAPVWTFTRSRDLGLYYVCRAKMRPLPGEPRCDSRYMSKARLEEKLDMLFAGLLMNRDFLGRLNALNSDGRDLEAVARRLAGLEKKIDVLKKRRGRLVESYIDGLISRAERDEKLGALERDLHKTETEAALESQGPAVPPVDELKMLFRQFHKWRWRPREQKRALLSLVVPRIVVRNYGLLGIRVIYPTAGNIAGSDLSLPTEPAFFGLDESFHTEMATPT